MTEQQIRSTSMRVLVSAILLNLTIQVVYVWSIFRNRIRLDESAGGWGWESAPAALPYTLGLIFFAIGVCIGGRLIDKIAPRLIGSIGGAMVGGGLIICGLVGNNPAIFTFSFGIITGLGIGFCYSAALTPSLKWFHPSKKGLISGLVLAGFGLASVQYSFISNWLLDNFTIAQTFLYLGIAIAIISIVISQLIKNPPEGFTPITPPGFVAKTGAAVVYDYTTGQMLRQPRFYFIFVVFFMSATIGLMFLGNIVSIVAELAPRGDTAATAAFGATLVAGAALMNAIGRIAGGKLSDNIGRPNALFIALALQLLNLIGFLFYQGPAAVTFGVVMAGWCFGMFLAIFPPFTADHFGVKNSGGNYGVMYLAFGVAGFIAPMMAGVLVGLNDTYRDVFIVCAVLMVITLVINGITKKVVSTPLPDPNNS